MQVLFLGIVLSWLVFPVAQRAVASQDGLAYLTAGRLVGPHPGAIYVHRQSDVSWKMDPRFLTEACHLAPAGTNCAKVVPPFLSAPAALPLVVLPAELGSTAGNLAIRECAVGAMTLGMWVLWRRLTRRPARTPPPPPSAERALVVAAVLMTPFAYQLSSVGQASSLLFLAACLGLPDQTRRAATWASAATWTGAIVFKLFPAALLVVAISRRRWRLIGLTAALLMVLTAVAALAAPGSIHAFIEQLRPTTATQIANGANVSLDGLLRLAAPRWGVRSAWFAPAVLVRATALLAFGIAAFRTADDDVVWAFGWVALLLIEPVVWWHYLAVLVALAALVAARRPDLSWAIAFAALPLVPAALTLDSGVVAWLTVLTLLAAVAAAAWSQGAGTSTSARLLLDGAQQE